MEMTGKYGPSSMDEGEDELDAIVGAALKGMVGSGASSAKVGAFAASFRDEVATILGRKEAPAQATELLELVTQAVQNALGASGVQPRKRQAPAKRIYVECNGRATSVSIPAEMLLKIDTVTGGRKQTVQALRDIARSVPGSVENRSEWVRQRALLLSEQSAEASSRH